MLHRNFKNCLVALLTVCILITAFVLSGCTDVNETGSDSSAGLDSSLISSVTVPDEKDDLPKGVTLEEIEAVMYVSIDSLNVRAEPNSDCEILGTVTPEDEVTVTGKCSNGWYRIDFEGKKGYCFGGYLSADKDAAIKNTDKSDNMPYYITVNRTQNVVIIYGKDDSGEYTVPLKAMVCSVGTDGKTPTGTYQISDKYTWGWLAGGVCGQYATRITGPYLFHSVPYFSYNKGDLEYEEYNKLGSPASLGCVRLAVIDVKWIFDNCPKGTTVTIYDSDDPEPLPTPDPIRIDVNDSRRGWDPTDPDPANPWKTNDE